MVFIPFNLNNRVKVKLTEAGLAQFRRKRQLLNSSRRGNFVFPLEPQLDADDYYTTQMWALMQDFGHMIEVGIHPNKLPFEIGTMQIEIQE